MKQITLIVTSILIFLFTTGCSKTTDLPAVTTLPDSTTPPTDAAESLTPTMIPTATVVPTATPYPDASTYQTPRMTLIGHASVKIETKEGQVIYIDPKYPGDYKAPANLILVTHSHTDHNDVSLITSNDSTTTITYKEALIDGKYQTFDINGIHIEAVPAYNSNHSKNSCVGYFITFDGITVYHAGDTSIIDELSELSKTHIDYALLPVDGIYNMDGIEATSFAKTLGASYNIPIHTSEYSTPYGTKQVNAFTPDGKLVVGYGETITLHSTK